MRKVDLTGKKFGRLTVVQQSEQRGNRNQIKWDCLCECGNEHTVDGESLKHGCSKSCGCAQHEPRNETHGLSKSRIYRIYRHMINRCSNKNLDNYYLYGGRGITVCAEWMKFENFYEWAMKNGYQEHLSIDRKDNNKGYCPDNCQWSDKYAQARNKRTTALSEEDVVEIRLMRAKGIKNIEIARRFGISETHASEVARGMSWPMQSQPNARQSAN